MISILAVAAAGLLAVGGVQTIKRHGSSQRLIDILTMPPEIEPALPANTEAGQSTLARVNDALRKLDDRYQYALQQRIDRLVSGTRHAQWQEIYGSDRVFTISPEDRLFNNRIARLSGIIATGALAKLYTPFLLLTIPLAFYDIFDYGSFAYQDLKATKRLQMKHLFAVLTVGLWVTGYFVVGGLSYLLFTLIMKAMLQAQDRTRKELVNILGEQPRKVWLLADGVEMEIPFEQLQVGDTLVVQAGQMIPVDGVITAGAAAIDQHRLTGESQPVEKGIGDAVLAATVVLSGRLHVTVEKTGESTLAAQIGEVLANTLEYHLEISERGKAIADGLVAPTLILSGLAAVVRGLSGAVSVLSTMPGVDMMFLGPISLINFLNLASRHRVLIKDGRSLELMRKVDVIVFDKTGTLTLEQPQVKAIHLCADIHGDMTEDTILTYAAAAEQRQSHPIAKAILQAAEDRGLPLPSIQDAHYELGYGLRVWIVRDEETTRAQSEGINGDEVSSSRLIRVGSERFMTMESVTIPPEMMAVQAAGHELGHSLVMVAVEDTLIGMIELQPTVRPEARAVIEALHERNIETAIISGDQEAPTRTLARELGISRYFANVLPEEKAALVQQLQSEGTLGKLRRKTVCFVGDGINDAIALKKAEVSVSLRGATTIATDTAQIVLMDQTLENLPILFDLSHELERNLMTSLILVTVPSCFLVGGIFFFGVGLPLAVSTYTAMFAAGVVNATSPMFRQRLRDSQEESEGKEV